MPVAPTIRAGPRGRGRSSGGGRRARRQPRSTRPAAPRCARSGGRGAASTLGGPRGLPRDPPGGRGYTVSSACAGGARTGRATVTVAETGTVLRTTMCSKIPHGPIPVQSV